MQTLAAYLPTLIAPDGTFTLPAGDGRTAWVDTRDIAAVAAAVLQRDTHAEGIYDVTGPQALSMDDVAAILTEVTGTPIAYRDASAEAARWQMQGRGLGAASADFLVAHYSVVKSGGFEQVSRTVADVAHVAPRSFASFAAEDAARWGYGWSLCLDHETPKIREPAIMHNPSRWGPIPQTWSCRPPLGMVQRSIRSG